MLLRLTSRQGKWSPCVQLRDLSTAFDAFSNLCISKERGTNMELSSVRHRQLLESWWCFLRSGSSDPDAERDASKNCAVTRSQLKLKLSGTATHVLAEPPLCNLGDSDATGPVGNRFSSKPRILWRPLGRWPFTEAAWATTRVSDAKLWWRHVRAFLWSGTDQLVQRFSVRPFEKKSLSSQAMLKTWDY